jgi:hypothetical protein
MADCSISNCSSYGRGGAIAAGSSEITLSNTEIYAWNNSTTNSGGSDYLNGAVSVLTGSLEVTGGQFTSCRSYGRGGAIAAHSLSALRLSGVLFADNWAFYGGGGAIALINSNDLIIEDCYFEDNHCQSGSGAPYQGGGAVAADTNTSTVSNSVFYDNNNSNSKDSSGGALFFKSGNITVSLCEFYSNSCGRLAGAIFKEASNGSLFVSDSLFSGNTGSNSNTSSGAIYASGTGSVENCIFYGNAGGDQACLFFSNPSTARNCTFAFNSGLAGYNIAFTNSILWGHEGEPLSCTFNYCDYEGGIGGTGNIWADPLFIDPGAGDYNVLPSSPCIGAGENGTDIGASLGLGITDCNDNGISDSLELDGNDCNSNGVPDDCEVAALDCNGNGIPDDCDITNGTDLDCNGNGVPDPCDLAAATSEDCNWNGIPDECDLADGSFDCDGNGLIDTCELDGNPGLDCDSNGVLDVCDALADPGLDCDGNLQLDECEILSDPGLDCDGNGVLDVCDLVNGTSLDCNANDVPDSCDIAAGTSTDCNQNGIPDECDVATGLETDCDGDGVADVCQLLGDPSLDQNNNGVFDTCECDLETVCLSTMNSTGGVATIGWEGSASLSAQDLTLIVTGLPTYQFGVFFYGAEENFGILGDGVLCVKPPLYRIPTPLPTGASGSVALWLDYDAPLMSTGKGTLEAFSTWHFQLWYRDPLGGPAGNNTSDALTITFCP